MKKFFKKSMNFGYGIFPLLLFGLALLACSCEQSVQAQAPGASEPSAIESEQDAPAPSSGADPSGDPIPDELKELSVQAEPASQPAGKDGSGGQEFHADYNSFKIHRNILENIRTSKIEKVLLTGIRDYNQQLDQDIFYWLLLRASVQHEIGTADLNTLTSPSTPSLIMEPQRYRLMPMRMTVYAILVTELGVKNGLRSSSYFPRDKPVWEIMGYNANAKNEELAQEPVRIYTPVNPFGALGKRNRVEKDGSFIYTVPGEKITIAGYFYKVVTEEDRDGKMRETPVIVAWQATRAGRSSGGSMDLGLAKNWGVMVVFLVIILLAFAFVFLRKSIKKAKAKSPWENRRMQRLSEPLPSEDDPDNDNDDDGDDTIDPELKAAVEEYRKEHLPDEDEENR